VYDVVKKVHVRYLISWWVSCYFWGFLRLCRFWWKSIKKCDRECAHRRIHTPKHWQTQTGFI